MSLPLTPYESPAGPAKPELPAMLLLVVSCISALVGGVLKGCTDDMTRDAIEFHENHADIVCQEFGTTPLGVRWIDEWGQHYTIDFMTRGEQELRRAARSRGEDLPLH